MPLDKHSTCLTAALVQVSESSNSHTWNLNALYRKVVHNVDSYTANAMRFALVALGVRAVAYNVIIIVDYSGEVLGRRTARSLPIHNGNRLYS